MRELAVGMFIIAAGLVATPGWCGAVAYLPSIGPAPLRFELVLPPDMAMAWKSSTPAAVAAVPAPAAETMTNANNAAALKTIPTTVTNTIIAVSAPATEPLEKTNLEAIAGPLNLPVQPDDASSPIASQLLAEFFKPASDGKTLAGTAVFTPVEIGFTPPSVKSAPESRAIYKSQ